MPSGKYFKFRFPRSLENRLSASDILWESNIEVKGNQWGFELDYLGKNNVTNLLFIFQVLKFKSQKSYWSF